MPKSKTVYNCTACGAQHLQWYGRCPSCASFGTLEAEVVAPADSRQQAGRQRRTAPQASRPRSAQLVSQIQPNRQERWPSGYAELDRVLGGGIVPGSLVLIGGDPGIGKSTLLLQVAARVARDGPALYVCSEESAQQVKLRARRLGLGIAPTEQSDPAVEASADGELYVLAETDLEAVLQELESLQPRLAAIDSIQTLYFAALSSAPGSVAQVRECTSALMQVAKRDGITLAIVGHVTKEGTLAGPRVLEHLVDTVLYFEGDRFATYRLLRSVKNRFGATHEVGIFDMGDRGLQEVANPSALFLGDAQQQVPGTATVVACEGTRPLLVELQALVSPTSYAAPRRTATGIDYNRLQQILAVLEKRVGIPLSKLDAYVATAGGLGVVEPAADLGIALAVVASFRDRALDPRAIAIGEVGLGGQVRPVTQTELRLKEAAKLGFERALVPSGQTVPEVGLEIAPVARVRDALVAAMPPEPQGED